MRVINDLHDLRALLDANDFQVSPKRELNPDLQIKSDILDAVGGFDSLPSRTYAGWGNPEAEWADSGL